MLASSPIPKQTVGRTFFIAIITLGVVAFLQIGAVGWAFIRSHSTSKGPRIALREIPAPGTEPQTPKFVDPIAGENPFEGATTLANPTPVPAAAQGPPVSPAQGRLSELLTEIAVLIGRGDMSTALIRLREAQALAPDNPNVLSQLAGAYEAMGSGEKATELWQRLYSMGKSAGIYYDMAAAKLNPSGASPDTGTVSPKPDSEGFQKDSVLALVDITKEDSTDAPGKKFKLKVPVKGRAGSQIDVKDVLVAVLFYDQLDDETTVPTNANVIYKWITPPVDWNKNNIQVLQVEYTAASLDPKIKHPEPRTYFGYIVRLYYNGALQDVRAEPVKLLNQFPSSPTLSNEDMQ